MRAGIPSSVPDFPLSRQFGSVPAFLLRAERGDGNQADGENQKIAQDGHTLRYFAFSRMPGQLVLQP